MNTSFVLTFLLTVGEKNLITSQNVEVADVKVSLPKSAH